MHEIINGSWLESQERVTEKAIVLSILCCGVHYSPFSVYNNPYSSFHSKIHIFR
jgi:hypothetical protein